PAAPPPRPPLPVPGLRGPVRAGPSHPSLGPRGPHHALESRRALSPPPPRRSRGGLPARSTAQRRASVPPPGRAASARGAASLGGARRSHQDPTSTARCRGACPARADHHPGVAGGAPERGLGHRRLAPLGPLDAGRQNHERSPALAAKVRWRSFYLTGHAENFESRFVGEGRVTTLSFTGLGFFVSSNPVD